MWRGFGGLWLLDGLLQLQPAMFTAAFVRQVLEPLLPGQPAWLEGLLRGGIGLWSAAPALADGSAAAVQLAIGVLLLVWPESGPRTGRGWSWQSCGAWWCGFGAKGWAWRWCREPPW
ncbi:MAG: hypothetical protein M0031_11390 [Thermaerobacter sp.]|nr:hypothetical protein [Thermaerobacter sp.]